MKKFSKIFESKSFLGYSKESLLSEFKSVLNPFTINIDLLYVYKEGDGSAVLSTPQFDALFSPELVGDLKVEYFSDIRDNIDDYLFSPMFIISLSLGQIPVSTDYHETNGVQSDNWVEESMSFDLLVKEFNKLSSFLEKYKSDFYISLERGQNINNMTFSNNILKISISLIMRDYFEYEQIHRGCYR